MTIGDRIAARRKALGMSQDELAWKVGYKSKAAISKIETNVNEVRQPFLFKFAEALETDVNYLLGIEPSSSDTSPAETKPEEEFPEFIMIARAGKKLSPERRADMLKMLKIAFPEAFQDED